MPFPKVGSGSRFRKSSWLAYAAESEVDHFAEFCETHLVQTEDRWQGKPLVLEPSQRRMLGEALAFDSDGWPTWALTGEPRPGWPAPVGRPRFRRPRSRRRRANASSTCITRPSRLLATDGRGFPLNSTTG